MDYLTNKNTAGFQIELLGLKDIGFTGEIIENGASFEENAKIKAQAVFDETGMACFADDSGLCVDFLDGAPGIFSARYGGKNPGDGTKRILEELKDVPDFQRTAHFYCAIHCILDKSTSFCVSGKCHGFIAREKIGENGFGYDPVFYYPPAKKTFAQLSSDEKNKISHRAKAAERFSEMIAKYY
ncbi:MAG: RdgB/HAM1 family non-canonical purine NTP pyrophosphatase [Oscillospiraceae bacterium]|nr:RdgB/HAM1 family non-canonical purine NTP pyrophosphatase [Oscillospiraceae bacterium]